MNGSGELFPTAIDRLGEYLMPLLEVRGLVKIYGRRRVVDGVDFEVNTGEVVGLLGPNGAGKTTSFRMATGQITPYAGKVFFNGAERHPAADVRARPAGHGLLVPGDQRFSQALRRAKHPGHLGSLAEIALPRQAPHAQERWERTETVLKQFGLAKVRQTPGGRLSGGEKRRLEIARCLVCEPLLILLDEPFTGIDPITIAEIRAIVKQLQQQGIGVLLTDHNVREALKITTRSYLIKDGKVRTHGTPTQIIRDPIAISEYLGRGFSEDTFGENSAPPAVPAPPPTLDFAGAPASKTPANAIHNVLEQEKIQRLIEGLKTPDQAHASAELIERGEAAVSPLLAALERRDVDMRVQALQVLRRSCNVRSRSIRMRLKRCAASNSPRCASSTNAKQAKSWVPRAACLPVRTRSNLRSRTRADKLPVAP